jgi:hypothetical protein
MSKFNYKLWNIGRQIEDETLPIINKYYDCDFKRNENDVFDILDFKDDEKKIIVEVKGRRISSTEYSDTIITASKVNAGLCAIDDGYKVYFVFVFTDKIYEIELQENQSFKVKFTGTNCIQHYLIPLTEMKEIEQN